MKNFIINGINYGTTQIVDNTLILTSNSRKVLTILPKGTVITVEENMVLNHNGTREDRLRAFEQNDYIKAVWKIYLNLSAVNLAQ